MAAVRYIQEPIREPGLVRIFHRARQHTLRQLLIISARKKHANPKLLSHVFAAVRLGSCQVGVKISLSAYLTAS